MIKKTIVAIGGGELGANETLVIDKKIVAISGKKSPNILFIPTASNDSEGYWNTFKNVYQNKLGCKTDVLFLINQNLTGKEIEHKINWAHIIYVGGGNTLKMMRVWRKLKVDNMLKIAYNRGVIMTGLSAGAICWFKYGSSDSRVFINNNKSKTIMRVKGLNLINLTISPHHIREKQFRLLGIKNIMMRTPGIGLGIDDNAALFIQDDNYEIIRSKPKASIKKFFKKGNVIISKSIPEKSTLDSLLIKS